MQEEYSSIAQALTPTVDLLLCETLSTIEEGVAAGERIHWGCPGTLLKHPDPACAFLTFLWLQSPIHSLRQLWLHSGLVASGSGRPWWISWSLADTVEGKLRSGEQLQVCSHANVEENHSPPTQY